ncbi:hypothetical protein [Pseudobutyrivibrio sp. MD2005]|uniref:hypothetical protein n=1 Tax=Pseudobutyrivibrio sp. MD2005 TaxID=1410616 RepID=UPI0004819E9B|nr:hypothetical protein [Pseudobutyrivibrio sp. MD2005]
MEIIIYSLARALGANIILIIMAVLAVMAAKGSKIAAFVIMGIAAGVYGLSFVGNLKTGYVDTISSGATIFIFVVSILLIITRKTVNAGSCNAENA